MTIPKKPTQLLSIPSTAARLDCSRGHVYHLIAAGRLRSVQIKASGSRAKTRIRERDLEAFIEANTYTAEGGVAAEDRRGDGA